MKMDDLRKMGASVLGSKGKGKVAKVASAVKSDVPKAAVTKAAPPVVPPPPVAQPAKQAVSAQPSMTSDAAMALCKQADAALPESASFLAQAVATDHCPCATRIVADGRCTVCHCVVKCPDCSSDLTDGAHKDGAPCGRGVVPWATASTCKKKEE
jgi:hypothetical protein